MANFDPPIPFGKHKGTPLSQVPLVYLDWMAFTAPQDRARMGQPVPVTYKGVNWSERAAEEIARRSANNPILQAIEHVNDGADLTPVMDLEHTVPPPYKIQSDSTISLHANALNGASKCILKEFVLRTDKSQGLFTWMREVAIEAARTGTETTIPSITTERKKAFVYMKAVFVIEQQGEVYILREVFPHI